MRPLSPLSLVRGSYYYFVSALAALWLLSLHLLVKPSQRAARQAFDVLLCYCGCCRRHSRTAASIREEERAKLARAEAKLNLPPYQHEREAPAETATGSTDRPEPWSLAAFPLAHRTLTTRDGTRLTYHILNPGCPRLIVLASGLGFASDFTVFSPLVHRYGRKQGDFSFLSWNYRGLFSSRSGGAPRRLAIPNHAEDLAEIMQREGYRVADLIVGHSCGVQIALEFCSLYPERALRLALINGTYGNVFETALQPLFRVPFLSSLTAWVVESFVDHPRLLRTVAWALRPALYVYVQVYRRLLQSEYMEALLGPDYFQRFLDGYVHNALSSEVHSVNYLRLFQELNAHSAYHLLRDIRQPTLVISGLLDVLTPAYLSFEMARRLPRGRHVVAKLSAHVALLEQPELVITEISNLLERTPLPYDIAQYEQAAARSANGRLQRFAIGSGGPDEQCADDPCMSPMTRAGAAALSSSLLHPPGRTRTTLRPSFSRERGERERENSHSRARMSTSYFPHDSDDEAFEHVDDHAALQFEVTDEAAAAEAEAEAVKAVKFEAEQYHADVEAACAFGGAEVYPEDIPTQEELDEAAAMLQAAGAAVSASAVTAAAATTPSVTQTPAQNGAPASDAPASVVSFDPSSPPPAWSERPVGVLTCADQGHRKHDDEALMRLLRAAGVPAEHVVWHAPARPWSHYRAIVVRSVWKYFLRPAEWEATLAAIEAAGIPCANSVAALRWNSNKVYLRAMAAARDAHTKDSAGSGLGSDPHAALFDFIPTEWLTQSDLARPASVEQLLISRGWSSSGGVLKPTSSAGGFGTIRLPTVGNRDFARAVRTAHDHNVQEARPGSGEPTWMLQPFQPQIIDDGEYSFFFLLSPGEGESNANANGNANGKGGAHVHSGPHMRFIHAGQKRPAQGSFLVQPIQGGILTPWHPSDAQVDAARSILRATPFVLDDDGARGDMLLYVRVDCIRARDVATGRPCPDGKFLLMEVEAIEPDFYSHLTPGFEHLYFDAVRTFLMRTDVWENKEDKLQQKSGGVATPAKPIKQQEDGATVGAGAHEHEHVRTPPRVPSASSTTNTPGSVRAAAAAFAALAAATGGAGSGATSAAAAAAAAALLAHDPSSHVGQLIEHFEHVVEEETSKAALPTPAGTPAKHAAPVSDSTNVASPAPAPAPAQQDEHKPASVSFADEISTETEPAAQTAPEAATVLAESYSEVVKAAAVADVADAHEQAGEAAAAVEEVAPAQPAPAAGAADAEEEEEEAAAPAAAAAAGSGTGKKKNRRRRNRSKANANTNA